MSKGPDLDQFRVTQGEGFKLEDFPTKISNLYLDETDYLEKLGKYRDDLHEMQLQMYAHDRYAMLAIFQAMDAAGKDSTIEHVFSGVNPQGVDVYSFKKPSEEELDHDFLWRANTLMPGRGKIAVFNRSYYEEVLVCKVHPEIVTKIQRLPERAVKNMGKLYEQRYDSIRDLEKHLHRNGTHVVKFFLNVSKREQAKRFLSRLDDPEKNWKFNEGDLSERQYWDDYMKTYQKAIRETATPNSPWYIVPADSKKNMRLLVASIIRAEMKKFHLAWPEFPQEHRDALTRSRDVLMNELEKKPKG
ncbi:PPK2 family polyphosphate kinase [Verrucomicrobium sp. BvORR034]|uniref:PPK2 family polyphosphate kinase n=1 Tax=Verrucomicrobium sp. BvORR034 TaxID=1396418 RepID=UPI000678983F|nr:PPK2 family polyphosphate kinase [Verrucomicrobium sp. BvORR034]